MKSTARPVRRPASFRSRIFTGFPPDKKNESRANQARLSFQNIVEPKTVSTNAPCPRFFGRTAGLNRSRLAAIPLRHRRGKSARRRRAKRSTHCALVLRQFDAVHQIGAHAGLRLALRFFGQFSHDAPFGVPRTAHFERGQEHRRQLRRELTERTLQPRQHFQCFCEREHSVEGRGKVGEDKAPVQVPRERDFLRR